jgi:antirestriction protein
MSDITELGHPRIYVGSLSDYNAGTLHGCWIDVAGKDADQIHTEVQAMLARSPEFARFPMGGPAEEWAIHDRENFYGWSVGEWADFTTIAAFGQAWDQLDTEEQAYAFGPWFARALTERRPCVVDYLDGPEQIVEAFESEFMGNWTDWKSYVCESELGELYLGFDTMRQLAVDEDKRDAWRGGDVTARATLFDRLTAYLDWDMVALDLESGAPNYHTEKAPAPIYGIFVYRDES